VVILELSDGQKYGLIFGSALTAAAIVLSTVVFPFWHLIREDVFEQVEILNNDNGICYANTLDDVPKKIKNCNNQAGDIVTIKFGEGLAWAEVISP